MLNNPRWSFNEHNIDHTQSFNDREWSFNNSDDNLLTLNWDHYITRVTLWSINNTNGEIMNDELFINDHVIVEFRPNNGGPRLPLISKSKLESI